MYPVSAATSFDVVVIGRGAIGAAAALGFAQSGLRVAIVGPNPAGKVSQIPQSARATDVLPLWDSRVFALSPASRTVLEQLRVWGAIDHTRVAPVYDMRVYPKAGPRAPELHFSAYESRVESLAWIIENRNLIDALERAMGFAGIVCFDSSLVAIDSQATSAAVLTLADGRHLQAKLVIGADGADSPLRQMLGIQTSVHDYPQHAVVANFEIGAPHRDCAYQWFGDHGILALLPLPENRCSMVWSAPLALAQTLQSLDSESLSSKVLEACGGCLGAMKLITAPQTFPLRLIEPERQIAPRVALVGDAAHVVHPLAGQGMNLGFGDLSTLFSVMREREPFRDLGDPMLLRRYERARKEPVATMKLVTDGLQRLFDARQHPDLPLLLRPILDARDAGWQLLESFPWLKRRLIAHAVS